MIKEAYKYCSTQIALPNDMAQSVHQWVTRTIDPNDFYVTEGDGGRDRHPHVTLKYGIVDQHSAPVTTALKKVGPINVRLGNVTIFDAPKYDVLKIDVHGEDLHKANDVISKHTRHVNTHPRYNPHVTLAYLKKGTGQKYIGRDDFFNQKFVAHNVEFTCKDGKMTKIPVRGGHVGFSEKLAMDIQNAVIAKLAELEQEKTAGKKRKKGLNYSELGAQAGGAFTGAVTASVARDIQNVPVNAIKNRLYSLVQSAGASILKRGR